MATITMKITRTFETESEEVAYLLTELLNDRKDGSVLTDDRTIYDMGVEILDRMDEVTVT